MSFQNVTWIFLLDLMYYKCNVIHIRLTVIFIKKGYHRNQLHDNLQEFKHGYKMDSCFIVEFPYTF